MKEFRQSYRILRQEVLPVMRVPLDPIGVIT